MPAPSLPPSKRRKTAGDGAKGVKLSKIDKLEHELTLAISNSASLNHLADLVLLSSSTADPVTTHKAIYALYRIFTLLITKGRLSGGKGEAEEAKVVRVWLNERLGEYVVTLCGMLKDDQKALRTAALEILMSLLKHLSTKLSKSSGHPQVDIYHLRKIFQALLICPPSSRPGAIVTPGTAQHINADVRDTFLETWLSVYDDLRWFFFRESTALLKVPSFAAHHANIAINLLSLVERLTTMPTSSSELNQFWIVEFAAKPPWSKAQQKEVEADEKDEDEEDDWRTYFDEPTSAAKDEPQLKSGRAYKLSVHHSLHSLPSHRAHFSYCWLALLPHLAAESALSARALTVLHRGVMPHMARPLRLMDWVSGCVDFGESIGLLALNALYQLMTEYNLDYPDFYKRLYAFLTRDVLHLKHRARFFRLAETFLSSSHLPSALLASFVKRLARLSLSAPPAAIIMVIPFVYNILKRHPTLMCMIHNTNADGESSDTFNATESSPMLTNALNSSLWELSSHNVHYLPSVSTLARIFSEAFTKPGYAMEDFLDHTYATLFESEMKRKIKTDPALSLQVDVASLFPAVKGKRSRRDDDEEEEEEVIVGDAVSDLWRF